MNRISNIILIIIIPMISFGQTLKTDSKLKLTPITEFDDNDNLIKFIQLNDSRTGYDTLIRKYDKNDNLIYQYVNAEKWVMNPTFEKKTVSKARTGSYSFEEINNYNTYGNIIKKTRIDWKGYNRENESIKYIQFFYSNGLIVRQIEYDSLNTLIRETSFNYQDNKLISKVMIDSVFNKIEDIKYAYNRSDSIIKEQSYWQGSRNYLRKVKYNKTGIKKKVFIKYNNPDRTINRKEITIYDKRNAIIKEIDIYPSVKKIKMTNYTNKDKIKDEKWIENIIGYTIHRIFK